MSLDPQYQIGASQIFTLFFVMMGPLGLLVPFAQMTRDLEAVQVQKLSLSTIGLSLLTLIVGAYAGSLLLEKWAIPPGVMLLTGGIVFFLVALHVILKQYEKEALPATPVTAAAPPNPVSVAFPMIVSPYGMAALIVLMSLAQENRRRLEVVGVLVILMLFNLITMFFAKAIVKKTGVLWVRVLSAAVSVLQLALAITIMVQALRSMSLLEGISL